MKKQRIVSAISAALVLSVILAILSSPRFLGYLKNRKQKEVEQKSIREQQADREKAVEGIARYNGITVELTGISLAHNIKETEIKEDDFCVSQIVDKDGSIIPDRQLLADTLLVADLELHNEEGIPFSDADYILLNFDFQSKALLDRNLDTVPMVFLYPHGPEGEEGKDYNRLYVDKKKMPEVDSLCLEQGETMAMTVGFLISQKWLGGESDPCIIVSTNFGQKDISLPIMEAHS
ncbi:MAG: hypothetical protein Q4D16_10375 [Eubacteriales bacterium]|nr:hypothetical protein [Eubacteriales bacterium]